jgi:hypothetical protein
VFLSECLESGGLGEPARGHQPGIPDEIGIIEDCDPDRLCRQPLHCELLALDDESYPAEAALFRVVAMSA